MGFPALNPVLLVVMSPRVVAPALSVGFELAIRFWFEVIEGSFDSTKGILALVKLWIFGCDGRIDP